MNPPQSLSAWESLAPQMVTPAPFPSLHPHSTHPHVGADVLQMDIAAALLVLDEAPSEELQPHAVRLSRIYGRLTGAPSVTLTVPQEQALPVSDEP